MTDIELKRKIESSLKALDKPDFSQRVLSLFATLGYNTSRQNPFPHKSFSFFEDSFLERDTRFDKAKALTTEWSSVDLLFQLSKDELSGQLGLFETKRVNNTLIETYLFFAIELTQAEYSRTALAQITREVNKVFPMPVLIVFKYGQHVTISVINRRLHKKDEQKDVLEKVTLIKDIALDKPHRAHIEILFDLSVERLKQVHKFTNFVELHQAWQKTLDTKELNKRFYRELSNWYFWAMEKASFPDDIQKGKEIRNATNLIRLLTRILFVWFIKEKKLVPETLFDPKEIQKLLKNFNKTINSHSYYQAILQNLFFATLNQKIEERAFATDGSFEQNRKNYGIKNLYRYAGQFSLEPTAIMALFQAIPFLNGGLFDCLDKEDDSGKVFYEDGFSRNPKKQAIIPDELFFSEEKEIDLSTIYDDKKRNHEKVQGLINILAAYKFTVTENTPIEEDVALDPELLGRVFENLLASYNPETQTTARKQTGSFYTPREIVNYMVDESLVAYLETALPPNPSPRGRGESASPPVGGIEGGAVRARLRHLLAYNDAPHHFSPAEVSALIKAIDSAKILDPACGSGAFPMGILHKLVHVLHKLDPQNEQWKERQLEKAMTLDDAAIRDNLIDDIETAFANNELDYGRKLYLIENCIYGVDIQPIATQISKLRFFISLIVDQKADKARDNFGIRPLPNLETKFVAANTLIGIDKPQVQLSLFDSQDIKILEEKLKEVRHRLFSAKTPATKRKLRQDDKTLREKMGALLVANGWGNDSARQLAGWDPYDQNASSPFFDAEWMFGVTPSPAGEGRGEGGGFDVVIGNPPYVRQEKIKELKPALQKQYTCFTGIADLYVYFFERGFQLLQPGGVLTYISSNKYFRAGYGEKLRRFLSQNATVRQLIDFGDAPVFTAIAYPSIISLTKTAPAAAQTRAFTWQPGPPIEEFDQIFATDSFLLPQTELTAAGWRLEDQTTLRLLDKLRQAGKPLGEYVNGRFYRGILTGLNEAFVVDRATRDRLIAEHPSSAKVLKPFLRGRDVKRWVVEFADQYLIKIESSENKKHPWSGKPADKAEEIFTKTYPAIYKWFQQHRAALINRQDQGNYFWELRSCKYWHEFEQPKILYPDIYEHQSFTIDIEGFYLGNTCYFIPTGEKWLCGLLNSKTVEWFYSQVSSKVRGGYMRAFSDYMKQIPIPEPPNPNPIESLVSQILAAKAANPAANVSALEGEIDRLVYELYGLTAAEIALVEGKDRP